MCRPQGERSINVLSGAALRARKFLRNAPGRGSTPTNLVKYPVVKEALRRHLLRSCPESELARWYDPLDLEVIEPVGVFAVRFPHTYFAKWFAQSVQDRFERQVSQFMGPGFILQYQCPAPHNSNIPSLFQDALIHTDFPFGHAYTFENFQVNEKNFFPLALAKEVAKNSTLKYNPFIVSGPSGSGKTHLLRAMANAFSKNHDKSAIFFGTLDDIVSLTTTKFNGNRVETRGYLQSFDWLIIDDFSNIKAHPDLEPEMVLLFNAFHDAEKQMCFGLGGKISELGLNDPTLTSRLEWGLVVHLKEPDLEVRIKYIDDHCRRTRLTLTKDQVLALARRAPGFRAISGMLLRVEAFRQHVAKDISDTDFRRLIGQAEEKRPPNLTPEHILSVVAGHFQIDIRDLTGSRRSKNLVYARQVAMSLCRSLLGLSYPALGRLFGGKDHSTVLYSIKKINQLQIDDNDVRIVFRTLSKKCQQPAAA